MQFQILRNRHIDQHLKRFVAHRNRNMNFHQETEKFKLPKLSGYRVKDHTNRMPGPSVLNRLNTILQSCENDKNDCMGNENT